MDINGVPQVGAFEIKLKQLIKADATEGQKVISYATFFRDRLTFFLGCNSEQLGRFKISYHEIECVCDNFKKTLEGEVLDDFIYHSLLVCFFSVMKKIEDYYNDTENVDREEYLEKATRQINSWFSAYIMTIVDTCRSYSLRKEISLMDFAHNLSEKENDVPHLKSMLKDLKDIAK